MRQLLSVVLLLILLNINIVISAPPKCLTTENVYYDYKHYSIEYKEKVDWWYLHTAAMANGAFYTDSALSSKKKIIQLPLYDARIGEKYTNPFFKTYQQVLNPQFNSIIYNEQIGNVPEGAHSKGFFIWNDDGGIHVIHSNPNTPYGGYGSPTAKTFMKESTSDHSQHAQHHFCRTIAKADLSIIPQYVILGDVRVAGVNGKFINVKRFSSLARDKNFDMDFGDGKNLLSDSKFTPIKSLSQLEFSEIVQFIKNNFVSGGKILLNIKQWVQVANQVATKKITSSTTNEWEYFSGIYDQNDELYYIQSTIGSLIRDVRKSQFKKTGNQYYSIERVDKDKLLTLNGYKTGYNILYEYISQQTGMDSYNWIGHTQTKIFNANPSKGRNLMAYDRHGIKLVFQYSFEFNHPKGGHLNLKVNSGHDHTKLFYGYKDENPDLSIMCIGDLNWQGKQEVRGGGLFCSKKMAYLANYLHRHVVFFRDTIGTEKRFTDSIIPNGGSLVDFDFSKVKQELENIQTINQLQSIGDINFEIRVLFTTSTPPTSQYIPLPGSRVIVMNKPLLKPQYQTDKVNFIANSDQYVYNCGYEKVNIPLLVKQNTINKITTGYEFDLEEYSFNTFTSNDVKLYICPNENNQDCDYEDSEYVQLFTHSPSVSIKLKKDSVNDYEWNIFKVDRIHYSAQFTTSVKDELVKRLKYVHNIALIKSIAPTYSKTIKISKGTTPSNSLYYFKDAETLCNIMASSDKDAIIIPYYDYCYDVLFYCFKRINEFKQTGDIINTADGFGKVYKEFKKVKALTNTQECFKYDDPPSGSNTNIVNSKNNNKNNPAASNPRPKRFAQTIRPWW